MVSGSFIFFFPFFADSMYPPTINQLAYDGEIMRRDVFIYRQHIWTAQ